MIAPTPFWACMALGAVALAFLSPLWMKGWECFARLFRCPREVQPTPRVQNPRSSVVYEGFVWGQMGVLLGAGMGLYVFSCAWHVARSLSRFGHRRFCSVGFPGSGCCVGKTSRKILRSIRVRSLGHERRKTCKQRNRSLPLVRPLVYWLVCRSYLLRLGRRFDRVCAMMVLTLAEKTIDLVRDCTTTRPFFVQRNRTGRGGGDGDGSSKTAQEPPFQKPAPVPPRLRHKLHFKRKHFLDLREGLKKNPRSLLFHRRTSSYASHQNPFSDRARKAVSVCDPCTVPGWRA